MARHFAFLLAFAAFGCGTTHTSCESDTECSAAGLVCDVARAECVQCLASSDCLVAGQVCQGGLCEAVVECTSSRQCPGGVCDPARGYCVSCITDVDCGDDERCDPDGVCQALCSGDADCAAAGLVCAMDTRECVQCVRDEQCVAGRQCVDRRCQTDTDAGVDAGPPGSDGGLDAGPPPTSDAGTDAGGGDAGDLDSGVRDAGADAGLFDAGLFDAGLIDAGGGLPDAGMPDAGVDGGAPDAGPLTDAGPRPSVLIDGLGGPLGYGTDGLAPSDDDSSPAISIAPAFPTGIHFYGASRTQLFMNNNGNVTFDGTRASFTADPLVASNVASLAPFFGDVDTRSGGRPAMNNVHYYVDGTRLVFTWHEVGYYNSQDTLRNTFQAVIIARSDVAPGDFDLEYRFDRCQWTTGDASGGTNGLGGDEARAGWSAGDATRGFELPGSGTEAVLDLCTGSNVGAPGVWRYLFRGGLPQ